MKLSFVLLSELSDAQKATRLLFDCGENALNVYLTQTASQHDKRYITRTFCAIWQERIIAYYSLSNAELDVSAVDDSIIKKYKLPKHKLPVVRLCRLAVCQTMQKQGVGAKLLIDALWKVINVSALSGCVGLVVDAKNEQAANFYQAFSFRPAPDNPLLLFMPLAEIKTALLP